MTRSVYVIGGAGTGKSTFVAQLTDELGCTYGPLEDLYALRNRKNLITLRGHRLEPREGPPGLYLGVKRESFPGTDGLDRVSCMPGEAWLHAGELPAWIVAEGLTLCTKRFMTALRDCTELLLVHLHVDPMVADLRFLQRGSAQPDSFVRNTVTRSANMLKQLGANETLSVDTAEPEQWRAALDICQLHLLKGIA